MEIDRSHWLPPLDPGALPPWGCPVCGRGVLTRLGKTGIELKTGGLDRAWPDNNPIDMGYCRYLVRLQCGAPPCQQTVVLVGMMETEEFTDWDPRTEEGYVWYEKRLRPTFIDPAPPVFPLKTSFPPTVSGELRKAFALYWPDPGAASSKIRNAVALLLDHFGVKKSSRTKAKKLRRLTLSQRIDELGRKKKYTETTRALHASRFAGNEATHEATYDHASCLDDFQVIQHVLRELFDTKYVTTPALVESILRAGGHRRRKTK